MAMVCLARSNMEAVLFAMKMGENRHPQVLRMGGLPRRTADATPNETGQGWLRFPVVHHLRLALGASHVSPVAQRSKL